MVSGKHIVVVDGSSETEMVLKAILEPRGLQVTRIRADAPSHRLQDSRPPHLVVVHGDDLDVEQPNDGAWHSIPRVVIGANQAMSAPAGESRAATYFLNKPFQYPELIRVIERLLQLNA